MGDSFDLEPTAWRAAQQPEIAPRYRAYVVEHLRDGQAPRATAIFNPRYPKRLTAATIASVSGGSICALTLQVTSMDAGRLLQGA